MRPDAVVVMTADATAIEEFAADALPANVCCVGVQPYGEMQALLADCDVYLATMLESSGQGHLEAMYLGKPVIGYRWGGVGELAGGVAQLVDPDDLAGLAHALDYALANYATLGAAGRALVEARHLWPAAAAEYKDIYEELQ